MYRADVEENKVYLDHFGLMAPFDFCLDSSPEPPENNAFSQPISSRRLKEEKARTQKKKKSKSSIDLYNVPRLSDSSGFSLCVLRSLATKLTKWKRLASLPEWKFTRLDIKCYSAELGKEYSQAKISLKFEGAKTIRAVSVIRNNTFDPSYVMPRDDVWIRVKGYGSLKIGFGCYRGLFPMDILESKETNIPKDVPKYNEKLRSWMKKLELDTWKRKRSLRRSHVYVSSIIV